MVKIKNFAAGVIGTTSIALGIASFGIRIHNNTTTNKIIERFPEIKHIPKTKGSTDQRTLYYLEEAHKIVENHFEYNINQKEKSLEECIRQEEGVCSHYAQLTEQIYHAILLENNENRLFDKVRRVTGCVVLDPKNPDEWRHEWLKVYLHGRWHVYEATEDAIDRKGMSKPANHPLASDNNLYHKEP